MVVDSPETACLIYVVTLRRSMNCSNRCIVNLGRTLNIITSIGNPGSVIRGVEATESAWRISFQTPSTLSAQASNADMRLFSSSSSSSGLCDTLALEITGVRAGVKRAWNLV